MMATTKRFNAKQWVEAEVTSMMDGYGNTRREAINFVLTLLNEGEYMEELTDRQICSAKIAARAILQEDRRS